MSDITSFDGENAFLSNFYPSPVLFEGDIYPTVEHAFQAAKTSGAGERRAIRLTASPAQAKRAGKRVSLRPDWEQVKGDVMLGLLRQKFSAPELRAKLLATGQAQLIEGNTWGDRVWGCVLIKGQWVGRNRLGRLLMQVRDEMRRAAS